MLSFGNALSGARAAAGLTVEELGRRCGLSGGEVSALEAGQPTTGAVMDRCALAFGLRVDDLQRGEAEHADLAMLFKRSRAITAGPRRGALAMLELDENLGLSRFSRSVWELYDLLGALEQPLPQLPDLSRQWEARPQDQRAGEHLARIARRELGLTPDGPIDSMRRLVEKTLHIPVLYSGEDEVDPRIHGASLVHPMPAVLVAANRLRPWVTRMTLAHELCHLLFHRASPVTDPGGLSVNAGEGWVLDGAHEAREQEANAFAAAFLVPGYALRQLFQGQRHDTPGAVKRVSQRFGVGRKVAVNRVVDTFELSSARRQSLLQTGEEWVADFSDDEVRPSECGLQQGVLRARALEALVAARITRTRARSVLGIPDDQPIEDAGLTDDLAAPVLPPERRLGLRLQRLLEEQGDERIVGEVVRIEAGGYEASLHDLDGVRVGMATLDAEGNLVDTKHA